MPEPVAFPETLRTERLLLRPPTAEDAPALMEIVNANLEHLRPWMPWAQAPRTLREQTDTCVQTYKRFLNSEDLMYLIFSADQASEDQLGADQSSATRLVGACGLHRIDWSVPVGDIGYWIAEDAQGQGYATEVAGALSDLALGSVQAGGLGLRRLEIRCDARNLRSAAVAVKLGFEREAVLKRNAADPEQPERLRDTLVFARWPQAQPGE